MRSVGPRRGDDLSADLVDGSPGWFERFDARPVARRRSESIQLSEGKAVEQSGILTRQSTLKEG